MSAKQTDAANNGEREMKIDMKGILKAVILLFAILIAVGVLTYVLPAGRYSTYIDAAGKTAVDPNSFEYIESTTRIPFYRWLLAPFETLIFDSSKFTLYQIIALLLLLGGCFKVLEACGGLPAFVKLLIVKFSKRRFLTVAVITVVMMLLCSFFGIFDELLILFPVFLAFTTAMKWDNKTALALVLISTGVGFTCALFNPLTVGLCSMLAGITVMDGLWFRLIMLVILAAITCVYLVRMAMSDEKKNLADGTAAVENGYTESISKEEKNKAVLVISLFAFVLFIVILFSAVPALNNLGIAMIAMAGAFVIGTFVLGRMMISSWKEFFKAFLKGIVNVAPSIIIVVVAFSIKYIAEKGDILHTIFHFMSGMITSVSPFLGVLIILAFVLVVEFFIPSATAKASLLIPILTIAPIPGISKTVIVLAYMLGDGYTNVFYPTCGTLVIGLGLANVSYFDWIKRTGLFQLLLLATSVGFLELAVAIGL